MSRPATEVPFLSADSKSNIDAAPRDIFLVNASHRISGPETVDFHDPYKACIYQNWYYIYPDLH